MSQVSLNSFTRIAQQTPEARSVIVSGDDARGQGRLGTFFTRSATHRAAMDSFVSAMRAQYGERIADMVLSHAGLAGGVPLSARAINLAASKARMECNRENLGTVRAFIREGALRRAADQLCAANKISDPAARAALSQRVESFLSDKAARGGFSPAILTNDALLKNVEKGLPAYAGNFIGGLLQALSAQGPAFAGGSLEDRLRLADLGFSGPELTRAAWNLGRMRERQPEGELSEAVIWEQTFGGPLPEEVAAGRQSLAQAAQAKTMADVDALAGRNGVGADALYAGLSQMPWDKVQSLSRRPSALTLENAPAPDILFGRALDRRADGEFSLKVDPCRRGRPPADLPEGETWPAPSVVFRLPGGDVRVQLGKNTDFPFADAKDSLAYRQGRPNSLAERLAAAAAELCGPGAAERQVANVIFCLGQSPLIPLKHLASLAGADFNEHANVSVSLSRLPDGTARAEFDSGDAPYMLEHNGRFRMTLDVAPDGAVSTREFAITPRGSVLRERENDAVRMARAERRSQAMALVEPLQTPERLLETTRARAEALCPDLRRSPSATLDLAKRIRGKIVDDAVNAAAPLTMEQVQTRFDAEIDAFFTRIEAGAANVPDDRRAAFLRASLELSLTLPPALAQAAGQLAGSGTHLLRALFSARSGAEARDALENLDALVQGVSRAVVIDDAEVGEDELMTMQAISLLMSLEEMGLSEGDALDAAVNSLTRQGSPCRDALYDLLRIAGSDSPDDDVALTAGKLAKACATRIAAGNSDAAQNVLQRLSPQSIRERDLSLARQRELFGPGGFEARGGSLSSSAERATGQRPPEDIGRALSRHMQSMEAQCLKKAQDLLSFGTIVSGEQRSDPDLPLDEQFSKDYARDGVFVDGRYYSPKTPPQGTGTSEADFIALFPNPEHARQLSRLMNQTLHANMIITAFEAPELKLREGGPGLFMMASLDDPGLKDGGKNVQSTRVETLAAAAGRYRILGEFQTISRRDDGPERLLTGVVMEVALGDQPRVESVRLDYLLRGREVVPGEG